MNSQVISKPYDTTAAISAHGTRITISVIIFHFEIISVHMVQHHEPVGPDAETAVTDSFNFSRGIPEKLPLRLSTRIKSFPVPWYLLNGIFIGCKDKINASWNV